MTVCVCERERQSVRERKTDGLNLFIRSAERERKSDTNFCFIDLCGQTVVYVSNY